MDVEEEDSAGSQREGPDGGFMPHSTLMKTSPAELPYFFPKAQQTVMLLSKSQCKH